MTLEALHERRQALLEQKAQAVADINAIDGALQEDERWIAILTEQAESEARAQQSKKEERRKKAHRTKE